MSRFPKRRTGSGTRQRTVGGPSTSPVSSGSDEATAQVDSDGHALLYWTGERPPRRELVIRCLRRAEQGRLTA